MGRREDIKFLNSPNSGFLFQCLNSQGYNNNNINSNNNSNNNNNNNNYSIYMVLNLVHKEVKALTLTQAPIYTNSRQ